MNDFDQARLDLVSIQMMDAQDEDLAAVKLLQSLSYRVPGSDNWRTYSADFVIPELVAPRFHYVDSSALSSTFLFAESR